MSDERYDGWTNRETWAVALYINNDQGWQGDVFDALRGVRNLQNGSLDASDAADTIREIVENLITADGYRETFGEPIPESLVKVAEDIGSLYRVNWDELGAAFLADLAEQDEYANGR